MPVERLLKPGIKLNLIDSNWLEEFCPVLGVLEQNELGKTDDKSKRNSKDLQEELCSIFRMAHPQGLFQRMNIL